MEPLELTRYVCTPEHAKRFEDWNSGMIHKGAVDVRNETVNFARLTKPLEHSRVALVSTGGIRLESQPAFDLTNPEGDWSIRQIPSDTPTSELTIDHTHYNHGDADEDVNCIFPIQRLRELVAAGTVGEATANFYTMMGFIPDGTRVVDEAAVEVARRLQREGADIALLTAG